jgi:magnesium chelatase family protein
MRLLWGPGAPCTCSSTMITRYLIRISGPLMGRIGTHMQVPRVEYQKLRELKSGESSADVRVRVEAARERQRGRFEGTDIANNADMRQRRSRNIAH